MFVINNAKHGQMFYRYISGLIDITDDFIYRQCKRLQNQLNFNFIFTLNIRYQFCISCGFKINGRRARVRLICVVVVDSLITTFFLGERKCLGFLESCVHTRNKIHPFKVLYPHRVFRMCLNEKTTFLHFSGATGLIFENFTKNQFIFWSVFSEQF